MFQRVVDNARRYAAIDPYGLILKYICLPENINEYDMSGVLKLLQTGLIHLWLSFDMYNQPSANTMAFAGRFKAMAELTGAQVTVDYDLAESYEVADNLRVSVEQCYRETLTDELMKRNINYNTILKQISYSIFGYVEAVERRADGGLIVRGWAFDRENMRKPDELFIFFDEIPIFAGGCHIVRDDVSPGQRAGFYFYSGDDSFASHVLKDVGAIKAYAGFGPTDTRQWRKLVRL
jgi:hypothetical protein